MIKKITTQLYYLTLLIFIDNLTKKGVKDEIKYK